MTAELYDRVRQMLDLENNPAAGLIVHAAGPGVGAWIAYDVWESRDAWADSRRQAPARGSEGVRRRPGPKACHRIAHRCSQLHALLVD